MQRAGADEHRYALAGVEHLGGAPQLLVVGRDVRGCVAGAGVNGAVGVRRCRHGWFHLQVVGDDHAGDGALGERDPHGAVDQVTDLAGLGGHLDVLVRDVLVEGGEVDLLLVVAAEAEPGLLADDRYDRLVVELGVIEPVEQVDRAGAGGGEAHAGFAGELGVGAGHEGGHLLVANLDELGAVLCAAEGAHDAVDAVAGITVDAFHSPLVR